MFFDILVLLVLRCWLYQNLLAARDNSQKVEKNSPLLFKFNYVYLLRSDAFGVAEFFTTIYIVLLMFTYLTNFLPTACLIA